MTGFEVFGLAVLVFGSIATVHGIRTYREVRKWKKENLQNKNTMSIKSEYQDNDIPLSKALQKKNYPTKEEYEEQVLHIRKSELNSERYKSAYSFLQNELKNRKNVNLENELFEIAGRYKFEESIVNKNFSFKKKKRLEQYKKLNDFMNALSEEQINSNIYLKNANSFRMASLEDIDLIIQMLQESLLNVNYEEGETKRLEIVLPFSKERLSQIPQEVSSTKGIPYYRPQDYKISYVEVLDDEHKYVYKEYNAYVRKMENLIEDIYFWELCNRFSMISEEIIYPYHFHLYNNSLEHQFIASFFVRPQENLEEIINNQTNLTIESANPTLNRHMKG